MIFRKIILYGFFKKTPSSSCKPSPGSHANKDLVVGEKSQLQEGPGAISPPHPPASQGLPPTLRPLPCTSYPAPLSLGREKLRGPAPRRAAPRQPTLHLPCTCHTQRPRAAAVEAAPVRARARSIPRGLFFLPIIPLRPPGRPPHLGAILYTVIFNILTILPLYFVITRSTFRLPSLTTSTRLFLPCINSVNVPVIIFISWVKFTAQSRRRIGKEKKQKMKNEK